MEGLSYKTFGQVGHIRAAAPGNVHNAEVTFVNGHLHVGGPHHQKVAEILCLKKAYRFKKEIMERQNTERAQAGAFKKPHCLELLDQGKLDHKITPGSKVGRRTFHLDLKARSLEQGLRPDDFAGVGENQNAPVQGRGPGFSVTPAQTGSEVPGDSSDSLPEHPETFQRFRIKRTSSSARSSS